MRAHPLRDRGALPSGGGGGGSLEVVDLARERPVFDRHGVDLGVLVDTLGGSP